MYFTSREVHLISKCTCYYQLCSESVFTNVTAVVNFFLMVILLSAIEPRNFSITKNYPNTIHFDCHSMQIKTFLNFFINKSYVLHTLTNGPFAASGHIFNNPPCWRASHALGHRIIQNKREFKHRRL